MKSPPIGDAVTTPKRSARPAHSAAPSESAARRAPRSPALLTDFQRWFARAASRPLGPDNSTASRGVDGPDLRREATSRLRSHGGMTGLERLAVYNRQYWFRLITIMQEEYPCCLHVIGLDAFNALVIRYLDANPPDSPYLATMDRGFADFLKRRVRGPKRAAILEAAAYDRALSRAFDGPEGETLRGTPSAGTRWRLAGHVTPLWMHWDWPAYRALCLADRELTGRLPLRRAGRTGRGLCLHRYDDTLYEKPIARAEFLLLDALSAPRTLDGVFRRATRAATPREKAAMERHAGDWFRTWTELGWIGGNER